MKFNEKEKFRIFFYWWIIPFISPLGFTITPALSAEMTHILKSENCTQNTSFWNKEKKTSSTSISAVRSRWFHTKVQYEIIKKLGVFLNKQCSVHMEQIWAWKLRHICNDEHYQFTRLVTVSTIVLRRIPDLCLGNRWRQMEKLCTF